MTGHLNLVEGTARLGFMRVAAAIDKPERQPARMDGMRDIASDIPKEVIRDRPAWANHFIPRSNTNALTIPKTDARPPHPPHHSAQQAKA